MQVVSWVKCEYTISTSIIKDPWLPDDDIPYIQSNNEVVKDKMVSSLMIMSEIQWNKDLLNDIFEARDVNLILSIPLRNNDTDLWYWRKEKFRHYSVKTAYTLIQEGKKIYISIENPNFWRKI